MSDAIRWLQPHFNQTRPRMGGRVSSRVGTADNGHAADRRGVQRIGVAWPGLQAAMAVLAAWTIEAWGMIVGPTSVCPWPTQNT